MKAAPPATTEGTRKATMPLPKATPVGAPAYKQHNNAGVKLLAEGKPAEAVKEFQAALAAKPDYHAAQVNLGLAYLDLKRPQEAAAQFNEVLKTRPGRSAARDGLAVALAQQGKYDEAIAEERKLLQTQPRYPLAHYNIACWQAVQKKTPEAYASLEQAVKLGFRDLAWMNRDPDLALLRQDTVRWNALLKLAAQPVSKGQKIKVIEAAPQKEPAKAPAKAPAPRPQPPTGTAKP